MSVGQGVPGGEQPTMQLLAPIAVTPQPLPCHPVVVKMRMGGQEVVVLQMATPLGVFFFFMAPAAAKQLGKDCESASGAGIIVVPAGTKIQ